jgi:hypothetical protein
MAAMTIDTKKTWSERVAEWRASGLTSEEFSKGRDFTAGGLRHWAYRLNKPAPALVAATPRVRLARVLRGPRPAVAARRSALAAVDSSPGASESAAVMLQVGQVRIAVTAGFDRGTLATVLDVLGVEGAR